MLGPYKTSVQGKPGSEDSRPLLEVQPSKLTIEYHLSVPFRDPSKYKPSFVLMP
jgi:hypothetical protein